MSQGLQPQDIISKFTDCHFHDPENTLDIQPMRGKNLSISSAKQRSFSSLWLAQWEVSHWAESPEQQCRRIVDIPIYVRLAPRIRNIFFGWFISQKNKAHKALDGPSTAVLQLHNIRSKIKRALLVWSSHLFRSYDFVWQQAANKIKVAFQHPSR